MTMLPLVSDRLHGPLLIGSFAVVSALVCPARSHAQQTPEVEAGARVRVTYACNALPSSTLPKSKFRRSELCREVGTVIPASTDTLRWVGQDGVARAIHWPSVHELELSTGRRVNAARLVGFTLGLSALGLLAGAGVGCAVVGGDDPEWGCLPGIVYGGLAGGAVGLIAGIAMGAQPRDRWRPLVGPLQVGIGPELAPSIRIAAAF